MASTPLFRDRRFWRTIGIGAIIATVAALSVIVVFGDRADDRETVRIDETDSNPLELTPADPSDELAETEVIGFDGEVRTFAEAVAADRPTVVNFFASTCTPCRLEMPAFEQVSKELDGKVKFLGLAVQDQPEDALALVEDTGVTYEVARDRDGSVLGAVDSVVMPTTAFVAPGGTVLSVHFGELTADELRTTIDELFA